ncbi:MAG TPA: hypothetical protein IAB32_01430 [Candidatus Scatosoma pullicola]|nr:hypothetical protein [Candidatus Scatosoma pullicola]
MKFAFLIMGFAPERAEIAQGKACIVGVSSLEEACDAARELVAGGVGCVELCGAFGKEGARAVIQATGGKIPVGYVAHLPEQDELYRQVFGE